MIALEESDLSKVMRVVLLMWRTNIVFYYNLETRVLASTDRVSSYFVK